MTTLLVPDPWRRISAAARQSRADVAVAYLGQGATRLLPLRAGSRLVVDASEGAVRSGQTDPRELLKYLRRRIEVFSRPRLHAKVFAFSRVAYVGSMNVSSRSAEALVEAAVAVSDRASLAGARRFVRDLATAPLGEEFLKKLARVYRPPRVPGGGRHRRRNGTRTASAREASPLRIVSLVRGTWSDAEYQADEAGREAAKKLKSRGFKLDSFSWGRWPHRDLDEEVLMVTRNSPRLVTLAPPGRVLVARKVRGSNRTVVQVEVPSKYRRKLSKVRERLGRAVVKRLRHGGRLAPRYAARIRSLW